MVAMCGFISFFLESPYYASLVKIVRRKFNVHRIALIKSNLLWSHLAGRHCDHFMCFVIFKQYLEFMPFQAFRDGGEVLDTHTLLALELLQYERIKTNLHLGLAIFVLA